MLSREGGGGGGGAHLKIKWKTVHEPFMHAFSKAVLACTLSNTSIWGGGGGGRGGGCYS